MITFIEKMKIEHPEKITYNKDGGIYYLFGCPTAYGYEEKLYCAKESKLCEECWNRTIPGTENDILEGEKDMDAKIKALRETTNNAPTDMGKTHDHIKKGRCRIMDDIYEKEVRFDLYCEKCKHWELEDHREPCCECLEHGTNDASEKPVKFEEKQK